jgi:hypothetical protein
MSPATLASLDALDAELAQLRPALEAASARRRACPVRYTLRCRGCGAVVQPGGILEAEVTCHACDERGEEQPCGSR